MAASSKLSSPRFWHPLWLLPAAAWLVHVCTMRGYGWFRDEFYYVACARHLAWGYVDQPPLSIAILAPILALAGPSVIAMRFVIAVVAALTILTVGLITREIGGGPRAQAIAMLAVLVAPTWLGLDFFYSMNAFDLLAWSAAVWLLLRALRLGTTTAWAWLGVALGLGLLNKISVLWLGAGIGAGLVISSQRRVLVTPGPYVAAGIAGALFAPHVIWQIANGWLTLEFIRNASANKMVLTSVGHYAAAQLQIVGPAPALVGIIGLVSLLRRRDDGRLSMLAIAWVVIFAILALNGTSRTGYMAPAYAWLLAGGGVAIERWTARRSGVWVMAIVTVLVVTGVGLAPLALPVLPVETYVRYARALGVAPSTEEKLDVAALPQFFADMNGWPAFVAGVERAAAALPPEERARAAFFGGNYGEAGAVELLGTRTLPVYSAHNNYWLWGPPPDSIDAVVVLTDHPERLATRFAHVERAGTSECGDCMPYENHRPIYVAWGRRLSWAELWPVLKHYN